MPDLSQYLQHDFRCGPPTLGHLGCSDRGGGGTGIGWYVGFRAGCAAVGSVFDTDDGILVSTKAILLQRVFDTLTDLSDCLGIRTNVSKTLSMDCDPCRALGVTLWRPTDSR